MGLLLSNREPKYLPRYLGKYVLKELGSKFSSTETG